MSDHRRTNELRTNTHTGALQSRARNPFQRLCRALRPRPQRFPRARKDVQVIILQETRQHLHVRQDRRPTARRRNTRRSVVDSVDPNKISRTKPRDQEATPRADLAVLNRPPLLRPHRQTPFVKGLRDTNGSLGTDPEGRRRSESEHVPPKTRRPRTATRAESRPWPTPRCRSQPRLHQSLRRMWNRLSSTLRLASLRTGGNYRSIFRPSGRFPRRRG